MTIAQILFSFKGRIPRSMYWLANVGIVFVMVLMGFIFRGVADISSNNEDVMGGIFGLITMAVLFWISLAVLTKRWHDLNKPGTWFFIIFLPFIGALWLLVECGFVKGTIGANKYGDDPLAEVKGE